MLTSAHVERMIIKALWTLSQMFHSVFYLDEFTLFPVFFINIFLLLAVGSENQIYLLFDKAQDEHIEQRV
jgi:hypothetical protein